MRRFLAATTIVAAVLAVVGCGGDSSPAYVEPKGPPVDTLTFVGDGFAYAPDAARAPAGILELGLESKDITHSLVIEGLPGFQIESTSGKTDTGKVDLKPGKYTFYCDIPGHRSAGMEGTITVK